MTVGDVDNSSAADPLLGLLPPGSRIGDIRELSVGASRRTLAIDVTDAAGQSAPVVLQIDPAGQLASALPPEAQAAAMSAAAAVGVPVPEVVAASNDSDLLGGPFLLTRALEGETLPTRIQRDPVFEVARANFARDCGRILAAIHRADPVQLPCPTEDRLTDITAWMDATHERRPAFELAVRWLADYRPDPVDAVALHGDFRLGNLIVDEDGVRAVLDWELTHAGDPAEDVGWLTQRAWRFRGRDVVGGLGDLQELLEAYEGAGGPVIDASRLHWWQVFATLRWGIICQQQVGRHLSGMTRSVELAAIGRRVSETEYDLMELIV